ncbi:MAG TPA: radical SAM protein, partial [Bacteroidia bacterium]|nr:radical SAM protein [Bacteroidia bacterium]
MYVCIFSEEDHAEFPSALPTKRELPYAAWVTIQIGCDNTCAFCIVPSVRGPELSRPFDDIVDEVARLAADGVTEVTLLGQNVNSYGRDLAGRSQFADLLRELGEVDGLERVRFTSPHPRDFTDEVLHAMAETPNVCQHLHLPLQSGSDRVLRLMRRSYRSRRYLALI